MTLADRLTASRMVLAPVFFAVFTWILPAAGAPAVILLWLLFIAIEFSDLLDGMAARRDGTVSDFGKIFDPFADVFARITYFVCFSSYGIMPQWVLLVILYREFAMLFLRMLLTQRGVAMGARPGGKLKAVVYALAGGGSLAAVSIRSLGILPSAESLVSAIVLALYVAAAGLAVASFVDYFIQFRKLGARK